MLSYIQYSAAGDIDLLWFDLQDRVLGTQVDSSIWSQEIALSSASENLWLWTAGVFCRDDEHQQAQSFDNALFSAAIERLSLGA